MVYPEIGMHLKDFLQTKGKYIYISILRRGSHPGLERSYSTNKQIYLAFLANLSCAQLRGKEKNTGLAVRSYPRRDL